MFHQLGRFSASNAWAVCLVWLAAGLGLAFCAPHWDTRTQDDDIRFVPDRFTSVRAYQLLEKAFPRDVFASRLVFALERETGPLTEADFRLVDAVVAELEQLRRDASELKLARIDSYQDGIHGGRLTSADRQCTLVGVSLSTPYLALATMTAVDRADEVVRRRFTAAGAGGLKLYATGAAGIGRDLTRASNSSLDGTTWATVLLVIVVLLAVYRAPLLALIPLLTIAASVWIALNLLALMTLLPGVHLVNISKIFAIVILYGAGTDYCLFLVSRYREELEAGYRTGDALARSVGGVGEALAASAGTVMVGLGLMALAEFAKVRYAGPAIALSLGVALAASLTLTPALLRLLGKAVFWPGKPPTAVRQARLAVLPRPSLGFWDWVSRRVVRRPILVWCVATALLAPLVCLGLRVQPNYKTTSELSAETESLKGLAVIQRHFTAGEIGPVTVLLTASRDWSSPEGLLVIDHLSRGFGRLPNVAEVRSLTQPLGMPLPNLPLPEEGDGFLYRLLAEFQPWLDEFRQEVLASARAHYLTPIQVEGDDPCRPADCPTDGTACCYVTRLDVVLWSDPFEPESNETLKLIQTWLAKELPHHNYLGGDVRSECYGITAIGQDMADVTESDRLRVNGFVLAAILLILIALVRSVWMALYLLVTVLASYFAALGATVLMAALLNGQSLTLVDWRVPFFLFTILVAVGEDYNILLMSRALEEQRKHGPVEGMRRALSRTGGAITSCGLIMAGTFATLMLAGLNTLVQVGFALAFGVLVDTFLVRPFLVPACAVIFWGGAEKAAPAGESEEAFPRPARDLAA